MIHICIDGGRDNSQRKFACGIGPKLPPGDVFYFEGEALAYVKADCPGCNPGGPEQLGTPLSQLSGRPGHAGFGEFCRIASSWGFN
jgi:hypothetical protein